MMFLTSFKSCPQYLALVDGDDFIAPTMYETMVAKAEEDEQLDYVLANFAMIDEDLVLSPNYDQAAWSKLVTDYSAPGAPYLNPMVFRLSPVPWRKLYSMHFIRQHSLRFPEGDFFFEDNAFHFVTTLNAQRIGIVDEVFCFHRKGRAGQTSDSIHFGKNTDEPDDGGASKHASLGGFFSNINYIGSYLFRVFSRRSQTGKYSLEDAQPQDENRKFSHGEYKVFVDEYFYWICRQKYVILKTVRIASTLFDCLCTNLLLV
jgi:hypothetical protein